MYRKTCQFTKSHTEPICSVYNGSILADLPLGWHVSSPSVTLNQPAVCHNGSIQAQLPLSLVKMWCFCWPSVGWGPMFRMFCIIMWFFPHHLPVKIRSERSPQAKHGEVLWRPVYRYIDESHLHKMLYLLSLPVQSYAFLFFCQYHLNLAVMVDWV